MKKLSFYEQVGILIPGGVLLFGVIFFLPGVRAVLTAGDGISVGGLGIFLIVAYAAGQMLAAVGNAIEAAYWRLRGGMPSNWVVGGSPRLLAPKQIEKLEAMVRSRLELQIPALAEMSRDDWHPISRQIYSDVERHGNAARLETFNGNYGLNRGLSAALVVLALLSMWVAPQWTLPPALLVGAAIFLYRMHRFGVHYARELYSQFLLLPERREPPKPKERPAPKLA